MSASFARFNCFAFDLGKKFHDFRAANDVLKIYLTDATPSQSADFVKTDLAEFAQSGSGYTAGGIDILNDWTQSTNVGTCTAGQDPAVWTASADWTGNPFRYVVLYNDTTAAATDPLIGYWDFGSSVNVLLNTETFSVDFGASVFTITAS